MSNIYSRNLQPHRFLREQLRLFAFDVTAHPSEDLLQRVQTELSKRERLETLLEGELNFHGEDTSYASHDLHAFAAKFPPQLPKAFIRGLTNPGDLVFDPMMGSGTCVVEAILENRKGIGLDIDPLALRLTSVKTTPLNTSDLQIIGFDVINHAKLLLRRNNKIENFLALHFDESTKKFIDYWFFKVTQQELAALILSISNVEDKLIRRCLELIFSSIIITKSGGVSRARDLAHSRPHLDKNKIPRKPIEQFEIKLRRSINSIAKLPQNGATGIPICGDAQCIPIADNVIDLVVTSPPYANAIDYMRAHKFSLVWFGKNISELSDLRAKYIGSERVKQKFFNVNLSETTELIISKLGESDVRKASILRKYFTEMKYVLSEIFRILRSDSVAIIIVGTSTMHGFNVETHKCLAEIANELGFEVVGVSKRFLDRNKRMLPARFGKNSGSIIEQRIHDEYVIGLYKS